MKPATQPATLHMWPAGDDLPLFTGQPVTVIAQRFTPAVTVTAPTLFDIRPRLGEPTTQQGDSQMTTHYKARRPGEGAYTPATEEEFHNDAIAEYYQDNEYPEDAYASNFAAIANHITAIDNALNAGTTVTLNGTTYQKRATA